jgi:hypothetical protein
MDTGSHRSFSGLTGFDQVGLDWHRRLAKDAELPGIIVEINDLRKFTPALAKARPDKPHSPLAGPSESTRAAHFQPGSAAEFQFWSY